MLIASCMGQGMLCCGGLPRPGACYLAKKEGRGFSKSCIRSWCVGLQTYVHVSANPGTRLPGGCAEEESKNLASWFFDFNKLWGACVMRRAPGRTSPPRRRTRRRWTLRQASCQGQFVVCFAVSVCIFF